LLVFADFVMLYPVFITTLHLPIVPQFDISQNCELLRLTCRFYFPLQSYSGERTSSTVSLIGLVELTTAFHNFRQAEIGYFINSSAIYLPYPSFPAVSSLHVKFRFRQESR